MYCWYVKRDDRCPHIRAAEFSVDILTHQIVRVQAQVRKMFGD